MGSATRRAGGVSKVGHHHDIDAVPPETVFGFWVYIMTDCMIFASLFATFAVQHTAFAGGPDGRAIIDLPVTATETFLLLTSSTTCGFAMVYLHRANSAR